MRGKLRKFKLIDREGFLGRYSTNENILKGNLVSNCLEGVVDSEGVLRNSCRSALINRTEFCFFEEVLEEILWDGVSQIEVGMTVSYRNEPYKVEFLKDQQVLIEMETGLEIIHIIDLRPSKPSHKEETFDAFLKVWRSQSLDYAQDCKSSSATLGQVFDVCYNTFLQGKP